MIQRTDNYRPVHIYKSWSMKIAMTINISALSAIMVSLTYSVSAFAQPVTEEWVARYTDPGINGSDRAKSIAVDRVGNVYVTGGSVRPNEGYDFVTIKYDANGVQQWLSSFSGSDHMSDIANALAIDDSGNVYVTGETGVQGVTAHSNFLTIKYDPNGNEIWTTSYRCRLVRRN